MAGITVANLVVLFIYKYIRGNNVDLAIIQVKLNTPTQGIWQSCKYVSIPLPKSTTGSNTYKGPGNDAMISGSKNINLSKNGWFYSNASIFY